MPGRAHPNCWGDAGHVCQQPSGRTCVERGCEEPAGTLWTPLWCPDHDVERLERVSAGLRTLRDSFHGGDDGEQWAAEVLGVVDDEPEPTDG